MLTMPAPRRRYIPAGHNTREYRCVYYEVRVTRDKTCWLHRTRFNYFGGTCWSVFKRAKKESKNVAICRIPPLCTHHRVSTRHSSYMSGHGKRNEFQLYNANGTPQTDSVLWGGSFSHILKQNFWNLHVDCNLRKWQFQPCEILSVLPRWFCLFLDFTALKVLS